jgi:TfoX/Sxy family transcriptional regulator of competence genes
VSETEILERLRRLLAQRDEIVEKRMVGGRSFSVDGRMFCGVTRGGLMVRVGADAIASTLDEPDVGPMTLGGKQLAAFVVVAPRAIGTDASLHRWVRRGLDAVSAPEPSPEDRFADLVSLMTRHTDVTAPDPHGRTFGSGALKTGRSIFAMLSHDHLVVKLPRDRVAELISAGTGEPFTAGKGAPMREWVTVVTGDRETWAALAEEALAFVRP